MLTLLIAGPALLNRSLHKVTKRMHNERVPIGKSVCLSACFISEITGPISFISEIKGYLLKDAWQG